MTKRFIRPQKPTNTTSRVFGHAKSNSHEHVQTKATQRTTQANDTENVRRSETPRQAGAVEQSQSSESRESEQTLTEFASVLIGDSTEYTIFNTSTRRVIKKTHHLVFRWCNHDLR